MESKRKPNLLIRLFTIWGLAWFALVMTLLSPVLVLPVRWLPRRQGVAIASWAMRVWARVFTFPIGAIWFRFEGEPAAQAPVILLANHNSLLDTPAAMLASRGPVRPLAKVELSRVPWFGFVLKHLTILVDRRSPASRRASLSDMAEHLRQGISVLIFPEGTMNKTGHGLQPFQDGAFRLAMETGTPIQPLVVFDTAPLLPAIGLALRPGVVTTRRLALVDPQQFPDADALKEHVYGLYLQHYTSR